MEDRETYQEGNLTEAEWNMLQEIGRYDTDSDQQDQLADVDMNGLADYMGWQAPGED